MKNKNLRDDYFESNLQQFQVWWEVVRENNEIELTYTEFEILLLLAQNIGKVFSKEQIYDRVWKEPYFGDYNIVMSHIRNLREKIEDNPTSKDNTTCVPSYILYECGKARNICRNIEIFNGTYRYKCYLKCVYTP